MSLIDKAEASEAIWEAELAWGTWRTHLTVSQHARVARELGGRRMDKLSAKMVQGAFEVVGAPVPSSAYCRYVASVLRGTNRRQP